MKTYLYQAVNTNGKRSQGVMEAMDAREIMRKLSQLGLQPLAIDEQKGSSSHEKINLAAGMMEKRLANGKSANEKSKSDPDAGDGDNSNYEAKIKLTRKRVIQFTEELCELLTAGLQLEQALHAMENRSMESMRNTATALRRRVRDGVPFSQALSQTSDSFGELYCSLVAAGEASGALGAILQRQARYLNQMEALRAKVTSALVYPAFIVVSGIALAIVFITYLLPRLAVLVTNTQGKLPPIAQWMLQFSDFFRAWWWVFLALFIFIAVSCRILFKDQRRLEWWHRVKLKMPVFGPVMRSRFEVQFLETLGNLLVNGLPLNRAMGLVKRSTMNLHLKQRLLQVEAMIGDGTSLSRALEKHEVVRSEVVDMVKVGEQTGDMAQTLQKSAARFDHQLGKLIESAASLIQPVIVLVMAVGVGIMAWMMISVVYGTMENLRQR